MQTDDPSASAISLVDSEHRALGAVVHALQRFTHAIRGELAAPDFELLAAMLYYIDIFPEKLANFCANVDSYAAFTFDHMITAVSAAGRCFRDSN